MSTQPSVSGTTAGPSRDRHWRVPSLAHWAGQTALAVLLPSFATSPPQQAAALSICSCAQSVCVYLCVCVCVCRGCRLLSPAPAVQEILLPDPEQEPGEGRLALGSLFPSGLQSPCKHISFPKAAPESLNSNTTVAFINFLA